MQGALPATPVTVVFRYDVCGARPDRDTQRSLERQLLDLRHGEFVDAAPGNWLTWHGRGTYDRSATPVGSTAPGS